MFGSDHRCVLFASVSLAPFVSCLVVPCRRVYQKEAVQYIVDNDNFYKRSSSRLRANLASAGNALSPLRATPGLRYVIEKYQDSLICAFKGL